jgi:hypothetical protein
MSSISQQRKQWLGFYTSRPFWAGDALDVNDLEVRRTFADSMSAITYSFNESGVAIDICKDGMILLRSDELEQRISNQGFRTRIDKRKIAVIRCNSLLSGSAVRVGINQSG